METALLQTKLYSPLPRPDVIPRPRLLERLDAALQHRLALVSAPAGFGKTTLLGTWARRCSVAVAWLSLDGQDNDLTRFLRYLIAALVQAEPTLTIPPPGGAMAPYAAVLVPLLNQLARLDSSLALVLDDYHLITNPTLHEALVFLVDNAPPGLHLIVATRADPAFPLPRWRARRQLVEIRAEDLRFNQAETAAFLKTSLGLALAARELAALDARAEGWIAALQLVALSLRDHEDVWAFVEALSGSHRYVLDYLVEEVLQQQAPGVRTFLLQTAVLEQLNPALCAAVMDDVTAHTQSTLTQLERANLFLVSLDNERHWYRYHHLFRDFLRARLALEHAELIPELHRRASRWYAENELPGDAVYHALAAEDYPRASQLIGAAYPGMLQRGEVATLKRWVESIPVSIRTAEPSLMLAHAWARVIMMDVDGMATCLDDLERLVQEKPDISSEQRAGWLGELLVIRASRAHLMGEMDATITYAGQALATLPETEGAVRSVLAINLANAYASLGAMEDAMAAYQRAITEGQRSGNNLTAFWAVANLGAVHRLHGRWREAETLYRDTLARAERQGAQPLDGLLHVGLGLLHWDRWEPAAAQRHLEMGAERCRWLGAPHVEAEAYRALACLAQHQGEAEAARLWREKMVALARALDYTETSGDAALLTVQCQIVRGDVGALRQWLKDREPLPALSVDLRAWESQLVAHAYLVLGQTRRALDALAPLREQAESRGWIQRVVEILVLEAQAHEALGERPQALAQLEMALQLAQPGRFARPFVEAGASLLPLFQTLAAAGPAREPGDVLAHILAALDATLPPAASPQALIEPLTERELELLRLLPADLTTAEIAEQLVISYHTARTHLKHIYEKLVVHSRHEAITRARALNLLEPRRD
ncbi:MAG: tetratricopeptide repeat protein [Anaerolineae bacterium]|nr:tetratricopeptide repeat protein [Anaerolineae bacterium]